MNKTYHNTDISKAKTNVADLQVFGHGDLFKLISKASSLNEGWMKSTKAMEIDGVGCVVQVTTQQGESVAEALQFIPNVAIHGDGEERKLVATKQPDRVDNEELLVDAALSMVGLLKVMESYIGLLGDDVPDALAIANDEAVMGAITWINEHADGISVNASSLGTECDCAICTELQEVH